MTNSNASRIRSLTEAANSISNPITEAQTSSKEQEWANTHANLMREWFSHMSNQNVVDIFKIIKTKDYSAANMKKLKTYEVETVEEGVLGDAAKKIIQKIKDIKSDYTEWRDLAKQLSQLKQERKTVLADIQASAQKRLKELDAKMQKAAQKAIKELNAELDRLKVTDKERLGETVEAVEEIETVEEAVKIDRNMNIKETATVLMDIADALMGKNVVTQRERLMAVAQVLASKRFV